MNPKLKIVSTILSLLIVSKVFSATITITPTGTGDDANLIQTTLNGLHAGDTLLLNGNFIHKKTLYLPSDFTWILNGSLTLGNNAVLDKVGWVEPGIDARRSTGISETPGGAKNIDMSGGTYYGNAASNSSSLRFLNFVSVTKSRFHDMLITQVSDDNFTLGPGCNNNECRNLIGSFSVSGNALTDKGDHNTWYDCVAADCGSDGWTPKCQYSTFIRCIAQNNVGPGFGMYAREEGYAGNIDVGAHIIGNKFLDCASYGSKESDGFSFNISSNCPGAIIRDNFIQAVCYDNNTSGVGFRNKDDAEAGIIENNVVDIVCYGNKGLSKAGGLNTWAGGLGMENDGVSTHNVIENINGSVICYDNRIDVDTKGGQNCNITVYHPEGEKNPVLTNTSSYNNTVKVIDFNCSKALEKWCQQKYCKGINYTSVNAFSAEPILFSLSQINPNPATSNAGIEYTVPSKSFVSLKIYDISGREIRTLVNEKKQKGDYKIEFQRRGLPTGIYLYRIQIDDFTETKKFVLK
jgi:hypothetical protein